MREVIQTIRGQATSDGAGVKLTRVIGGTSLPDLDPFLLFDEFGSERGQDYIGGFPDHPHRGFETVTYMLDGRMRHADNRGNSGLLGPGSVQWMTAGRGIVHSEMPEQEDGLMCGFQLWVNLPAREKMTTPRYQDIAPAQIPETHPAQGVTVRVLAGDYAQTVGPVTGIVTAPLYLDIHLEPGARTQAVVPIGHNAFVFVYEGAATVGSATQPTAKGDLAVLGDGAAVSASAGPAGARLLVIAGKPLGEPVARYGPFVMNTREEIVQAIADFNGGKF